MLPRALAVVLAATGTFTISLAVNADAANYAERVEIVSVALSFPLGGCYTYTAIHFPGTGPVQPSRYSGYAAGLSFPSPPLPEDGGALWVNATGILGPETVTLEAKFGDFVAQFGEPGTWGPGFKFVPNPSGGSGGSVVATDSAGASSMPPAGSLFGGSFGEGPPFGEGTYDEAAYLARVPLREAITSLAPSSPLPVSLFLMGLPDASSHPASITINAAGLVYPPTGCFTASVDSHGPGLKAEGFRGRPINRFLEYCTDRWACDSTYLTNNVVYEGKDKCERACLVQPGSVTGRCYQPHEPVGTCVNGSIHASYLDAALFHTPMPVSEALGNRLSRLVPLLSL